MFLSRKNQSVVILKQKKLEIESQHVRSVVFTNLNGINPQWVGIQSLIKVDRTGTRQGQEYHEIVFYISSLIRTAEEFVRGIRGDWGIENSLHWVKDVVLKEDSSRISMGHAPTNVSIVKTFALNILRQNGYTSLTIAQRYLSHDIDKLLLLVE